jgi:hypothetical protein
MTATKYLPLSEVAKVQSFVQYTSGGGVAGLQTDLNTAFGATAGNIQCMADTTTGHTTNALVIVNDNTVFSVPQNNYVSWFNGQWTQLSSAELAASYTQYFTS